MPPTQILPLSILALLSSCRVLRASTRLGESPSGGQIMRIFLAALTATCFIASLHAQTAPPPRITVVMPTGAKAGSTVEVTVTGQDLANVEDLYFSFPGA